MSNISAAGDTQTRETMNRMYRWTRHVYDASRKFYLLGRDHLIQNLKPSDGEHIIEVGCGTARNTVKMICAYPKAHFYGLDASDEMLKTAQSNALKSGCARDLVLAQAYAQSFNPEKLFGLKEPPTKLVYSYALSIIPPWKESIDHGLEVLPSGGAMHIVDFGGQDGLPPWFQKMLFWWLSMFHVYHKPEILGYLKKLEAESKGTLAVEHLYKGYAYYAVFKKT